MSETSERTIPTLARAGDRAYNLLYLVYAERCAAPPPERLMLVMAPGRESVLVGEDARRVWDRLCRLVPPDDAEARAGTETGTGPGHGAGAGRVAPGGYLASRRPGPAVERE